MTTCPPRPASIIGGTKHSSTLIGPIRLTSIICCQCAVLEPLDRPPGRDPGDVHHHVHAAVGGVDLLREGDDRLVVGDVGGGRMADPAPASRISVGDLLQGLGLDVGQEELGAPRAAAASAVARPIPLAAPVIRQRLPRRSRHAHRPGRDVGLDLERVEGHRQHLVVADQHAELDQPDLVELPAQLSPRARRRSDRGRAARRRRRAGAPGAPTSRTRPDPRAPGRSPRRRARRDGPSARGGSTRTRTRCCGRRGGSAARSRRGAACRRASARRRTRASGGRGAGGGRGW